MNDDVELEVRRNFVPGFPWEDSYLNQRVPRLEVMRAAIIVLLEECDKVTLSTGDHTTMEFRIKGRERKWVN